MTCPKAPRARLQSADETEVQRADDQSKLIPSSREIPVQASRPDLPTEGYARLNQILAPNGPIPVSKSTWWLGVKEGRFPQPTKHFGPGISAWNVKDIRKLIEAAGTSIETKMSVGEPAANQPVIDPSPTASAARRT